MYIIKRYLGHTVREAQLTSLLYIVLDFFADGSQLFFCIKSTAATLVDGVVDHVPSCAQDMHSHMDEKQFPKPERLQDRDACQRFPTAGGKGTDAWCSGCGRTDHPLFPVFETYIGAVFDTEMTIADHVNAGCRSACFQIHNIGTEGLCHFLTLDTCERIGQSAVTSRLNFCISLLVGLPEATLGRIQRCQNIAARAINGPGSMSTSSQCWSNCTGCRLYTECTSRFSCMSAELCMDRRLTAWQLDPFPTLPILALPGPNSTTSH